MKIALIGVTGFVGSAILKEALDRGHEVAAMVRNPDTLTPHEKLHPKKGDAYNEDDVARLAANHDAVISAFNPGWSNPDIYNQQVKGTFYYQRRQEGRCEAVVVRGWGRQLRSQTGRPGRGSSGIPRRV